MSQAARAILRLRVGRMLIILRREGIMFEQVTAQTFVGISGMTDTQLSEMFLISKADYNETIFIFLFLDKDSFEQIFFVVISSLLRMHSNGTHYMEKPIQSLSQREGCRFVDSWNYRNHKMLLSCSIGQ